MSFRQSECKGQRATSAESGRWAAQGAAWGRTAGHVTRGQRSRPAEGRRGRAADAPSQQESTRIRLKSAHEHWKEIKLNFQNVVSLNIDKTYLSTNQPINEHNIKENPGVCSGMRRVNRVASHLSARRPGRQPTRWAAPTGRPLPAGTPSAAPAGRRRPPPPSEPQGGALGRRRRPSSPRSTAAGVGGRSRGGRGAGGPLPLPRGRGSSRGGRW